MTRLRSISLFGLSLVTLTFEDGTDTLRARQQVVERMADADLPDGVHPGLGPLATPTRRGVPLPRSRDPARTR